LQGEGQRRIAFKNSKKTKGGIAFSGKEYCGYKGREIADYVGVDEFFPFLLKADLGKEQWFRLAIQSTDGRRRFHCAELNHF